MSDSTTKPTKLQAAVKNPHNVEATKYYVFNETGNIMMATTANASEPIQQSVQDVFNEVAVFFAGMTRAITTTKNPGTGKPYSLYNYEALERVIAGSGLFVHVTEEDVVSKSSSFGADFSKELLENLLGLATGAGEMAFASAMVSSIGKAGLEISGSKDSTSSKVGNIVFVCEYLLGMPIISAIVVYADFEENKQTFKLGPCFSESSVSTSLTMHKDTYLFVTPKFIHDYAGDLDSIQSDPNYLQMIGWLSNLVNQVPSVTMVMVTSSATEVTDNKLTIGTKYTIDGQFLGETKGTLEIDGTELQVDSWGDNTIEFTPTTAVTTTSPILIKDSTGKKITSSTQGFTIAAASK